MKHLNPNIIAQENHLANPVDHQPWESEIFGIKMGRTHLDPFCISTDAEGIALLQRIIEDACNQEIQHLTLYINDSQWRPKKALSSLGFSHVDTKISYVVHSFDHNRNTGFFKVRDYHLKDREAVIQIIKDSYIASRFSNDLQLPEGAAHNLYINWLDRLYEERSNNGVLIVGERNNKVVACGGLSPKANDPKVLGNSFLVCSKGSTGIGYSLVGKGINEGLRRFKQIEFSTSASNIKMRRILEAFSCKPKEKTHIYSLHIGPHTFAPINNINSQPGK